MCDKILTISIAGYNVEKYIEQTLDSCIIPEIDLLDVIVVDDGATDSTAEIADRFSSLYPDSIRVVRKDNGGYGTTVNTSIELARGKYFKLLDGDDWFDNTALSHLVRNLNTYETDIAVNPYVQRSESESLVVDQSSENIDGLVSFTNDIFPWRISMHSITYRTQLLWDSKIVLPARRLYTDTLYCVSALPLVENVLISHEPLYQYRMGRDGQSISVSSLIAHRSDMLELVRDLRRIESQIEESNPAKAILNAWIVDDATGLLRTLYRLPNSNESRNEIRSLLAEIQSDPDLDRACKQRSKRYIVFSKCSGFLYPIGKIIAK